MSYDISFRVKVADVTPDTYVDIGECCANITWNVGKLIRECTGLEWKNEENNGLCKDVIPKIRVGMANLVCDPDKYRPLESPNGWGTVEGTINFFSTILRDWEDLIRNWPELTDVVTFWIT